VRSTFVGVSLGLLVLSSAVAQQETRTGSQPAAATVRKPDDFLKVVPVDSMSIIIPNQDRFSERGDALGKEAKLIPFFTASQAIKFLHSTLGATGVDTSGPLSLSMRRSPERLPEGVSWSLPIGELDTLLDGYGLNRSNIDGDSIQPATAPGGLGRNRDFFLTLRGKTAWVSDKKDTLADLLEQRSLYQEFTAQQRADWVDMDLMFYVGVGVLNDDERADALNDVGTRFKDNKELAKDVRLVAAHMKRVMGGFSMRDGIRGDMRVATDGDPEASRVLQKLVGEGESSLRGLPGGNVVAAGSIRGTTEASATLSGDFASLPFWFVNGSWSRRQLNAMGNILKELAFEVDETAVGLYLNERGSERGLLSLVMVLTPRTTPQDLISEMRSLSSFVNARHARDMRIARATYDAEEVAKLIQQLSSDDFVAREDAMAAIRKIGAPVLPELDKAMKSEDKLIAERAERLRRQIDGQLSRTARDLLGNDLLSKMDPKFLFRRNAAKPDEVLAEIVLKPGPQTDHVNKQLTGLFGSNWKRVRFAILEDRVIVLFGSETGWLKKATNLVNAGRAPLEQHPAIKTFREKQGRQRLTEWHFSLSRLLGLTKGELPLPEVDTTTFSSLTVSHSKGELRTNMNFPMEDLKAVGNRW